MKRLLFALLAIGVFVGAVEADDNVRAIQTKLKEGGFYFGEVDGARSGDLSAAITRYQIRNGLQITGKLDAETSKALGVKAEAMAAPARTSSETWRRLRKTDPKYFASAAAKKRAPAAEHRDVLPNESSKRVLEPADQDGRMLLSTERLRDYVAAFVLAGLDPQVGAELEFFAERVRYYNDGVVGREKIGSDLRRYAARWPQRRFWLAGEVRVEPQPDSRLRVTFPIRYDLRNASKHSSGTIRKILFLEVVGEDLEIVGVDERKAG